MRHPAMIALLALLLAAFGCAHFNTWSNAKRLFKEAEAMPLDADGKVSSNARKKYDESIARGQKLIDLYPDSDLVDDALFLMSRSYFMKEEYTRCLNRLDELDERFPEHPFHEEVLYLRGVCHLQDDDESRAIAVLKRLETQFPKSKHLAEGIFRSGEAEYKLGSWQAAIDAYRRLLDRFEESDWNDEARLKIARSQHELKQDSLAVETLRELALAAKDRGIAFEGQMLEAEILLEQKRFEECRQLTGELEAVAENFQSRPQLLLLVAKIHESEEDLSTTVTLLENVAKEFPQSIHAAEAWYRIGLIRQLREGNLEEARKAYEQVEKEVPKGIFTDLARSKKAAIQEYIKMQEEMAGAAADSAGALPDSAGAAPASAGAAADSVGAARQFRLAENQYLRLENPEQALVEYRKLLELYPDNPLAPKALYAIGYIQRYTLGDTAAALGTAVQLRERYPESEAAAFVKRWDTELAGGEP